MGVFCGVNLFSRVNRDSKFSNGSFVFLCTSVLSIVLLFREVHSSYLLLLFAEFVFGTTGILLTFVVVIVTQMISLFSFLYFIIFNFFIRLPIPLFLPLLMIYLYPLPLYFSFNFSSTVLWCERFLWSFCIFIDAYIYYWFLDWFVYCRFLRWGYLFKTYWVFNRFIFVGYVEYAYTCSVLLGYAVLFSSVRALCRIG